MFVKICGLTNEADAVHAASAGATALGVVFAPASPRCITADVARAIVKAVPGDVPVVGVFVDAPLERIEESARVLGLAAIQLHGSENAATCRAIRERTGRPVWKALPWTGDPAPLMAFANVVDVILLDAGGPGRGGTGDELPWSEIAERYPRPRRPVPLVLSGGLHAGNVAQAIGIVLPDGVDASSRLESAPGLKDPERVRLYVENARERSPGVVR